jgi:hypothetical protein
VKIGLGREANWDSHVKSAAHVRLEGSAAQKASASQFFSKFLPKVCSARVDAASSSTSNILSAISPMLGDPNTPEPPTSPDLEVLSTIDLSETASVPPTSPSPTTETFDINPMFSPPGELQDLLTRLRMTSKALPVSVPEGTIDDELAKLSGDFSLEVANVEPDEVWEYINKATDRVFGYGMGTQELSALIRHGQYGMDGVCDWLERAVIKLGSEAILLEGRIGRLIDAMELSCVLCLFYFNTTLLTFHFLLEVIYQSPCFPVPRLLIPPHKQARRPLMSQGSPPLLQLGSTRPLPFHPRLFHLCPSLVQATVFLSLMDNLLSVLILLLCTCHVRCRGLSPSRVPMWFYTPMTVRNLGETMQLSVFRVVACTIIAQ